MTQPDPWPSFLKDYKALKDTVRRLMNRDALAGTGMSTPSRGTTQADGSFIVNGDIDVHGTANFDGNTTIGGNLSMPNGIIQSDWLANLVTPQSVWKGTTADFGLGTGWSALTAQTQNAPSGATSVIVHGFVRLVATNTTASKDYLYSDLDIAGSSCGGFATPVAAGDVGTSFCSFARVLTGVSSVTLTAYGSTGSASWGTGTGNVCQISASVLWFR